MTAARSNSFFTELLVTCNHVFVDFVFLAKSKDHVLVNLPVTIILNIQMVCDSWLNYSKLQYFQFLHQCNEKGLKKK